MEQNNGRGESKYERLRKIGVGSYGVVFKCVNRLTGQIVAIKRYSENDSDPIIRKIAMREVRMLRQLRHPNLIYLIEVFRRKRRLHLVFNYCELTVLDVIEKYGNSCPLNLIRKIVWQIVNGINYCHSQNCIHRDIKPENILINQSGVVKLCDFGFARTLNSPNGRLTSQSSRNFSKLTRDSNEYDTKYDCNGNKENIAASQPPASCLELTNPERQALTEYVATRWYRAPELLIGEIYYDIKIDIWAIGCVTAELMRGEPIWPGKTDLDQLFIIKSSLGQLTVSQANTLVTQGIYDNGSTERLLSHTLNSSQSLERKLPSRVGDGGLEFVSLCLQMDPDKRPTSEELLKHSYIYSSKMPQFMKQEANSANSGTNYSSCERTQVPSNVKSCDQSMSGGQLTMNRHPKRSNSQSLALVTAQGSLVSRPPQLVQSQPMGKNLERPQQKDIPSIGRIESGKFKNSRKQSDTTTTTPLKARTSLAGERKSFVPVAKDRIRGESQKILTNKSSKLMIDPNGLIASRIKNKMSSKQQGEIMTTRDKSPCKMATFRKSGDRKRIADNHIEGNACKNYTSSKIEFNLSGNDRTNVGHKQQVDSSASSTLSDSNSFLPSLFQTDGHQKVRHTSHR